MLGFGDALTVRGEGGIMDGSPISGLDDLVEAVLAPWGKTPERSVTQCDIVVKSTDSGDQLPSSQLCHFLAL